MNGDDNYDYDSKSTNKDKLQIESDDEEQQQQRVPHIGSHVFQNNQQGKDDTSEFYSAYLKQMGLGTDSNFSYQPPQLSRRTLDRLSGLNITYHPHLFKYTHIQIQQSTSQCTIMQILVQLGFFTLKIIVLNKLDMLVQNSPKSNLQSCLQINGCFGKILYRFWDKGIIDQSNFFSKYQRFSQYFVQKIFYFDKLSTTENGVQYCYKKIHTTILEYCFAKIAYGLEIGPKIQLGFGFDLVCYKNGILLFMQRCRTLRSSDYSSNILTIEKDLKQALILFHSLRIIHNDIKFDNIMYSQRLSKIVFIDFGLSELIKQKLGKKTQSLFKGSYYFVSDQMKSMIVKNNGYVDLYWNDLHCLKKSFEFLQGSGQQERQFYHFYSSESEQLSDIQCGDIYLQQATGSRRQFQFHDSRQFIQGNSMIPSKQQQAITNFNYAEAELLQYQIFYVLYKKDIKLFRMCLSPQNNISQSLRVYIMNLVMKFLQQMQGCPIYDQIYYQNYFNYKYNIQYQNLKYSQQHEQLVPQMILSTPMNKNSLYQKIGKRYLKLNTKNELINHFIQNAWIAVFDEISQKIYHLTSYKGDSFQSKNNVDFTQYLQNFTEQKIQVQQNLCNILVYALTIPITQQKQIRKITKKMIMLFKSAALTLIDQGFIQQKLNIPKSPNPSQLTLRKQLIQHIQQITQTTKQLLLLIPGNIQNELQSLSYMLVNRIIQKYIFKNEFIRTIEQKKINLFINMKRIHSTIVDPSTRQKIKLLLYMNYCDHYDYKNAYRILEEISNTLGEKYSVQISFYCLAVYLKMFIQSINFHCGYNLLTRLKSLAVIFKQYIESHPTQTDRYNKKISSIYDFQSSQQYVDYYIRYLQLQILVQKGMADYNARQLQQLVLKLQQQADKFYLFSGEKVLRYQIQSQFILIKMMIYDLVYRFEQNLTLGKRLYNYYTRGMNDRRVSFKLLFRSNFYLGVEQKRVLSTHNKYRPYVEKRQLNQIQQFKKYSVNFQKLLKKQKLQLRFYHNYSKKSQFCSIEHSQCIIDFDQIITLIKSINSDVKIFANELALRISSLMTLFVVVFNLELDFLYQKIMIQLKQYVDQQIRCGIEVGFYLETMMILNDIVEDVVGLVFEERKSLPGEVVEYFWVNYKQCVEMVFGDQNKQVYPTMYWILKVIVERHYYNTVSDMNQRYKTELVVLQTLDYHSDISSGFRHLNFIVQFFARLESYQMNLKLSITQSIYENQRYLLDVLKNTVQTIVGTNRRYLLLFYYKFTETCIKIFYEYQYFHSIFFLFEVMANFVKKFPGQKNMDTFCQLSNLLEKLEISQSFVHTISEIVADKMIEKELQSQFPQIVTFFIILCTKIIALNFNSVLKSEWFLKKMTFQFQRLPRYMKKKFLPKYLNMFGQFYQRKQNKKKSFQMKMKFLRVLKLQDFIWQKWKKYNNCVYFLDQKLKLKSRLNEQNYISRMVALNLHLKLRKLYFASLITQPQPPINRLQKMEIYQ